MIKESKLTSDLIELALGPSAYWAEYPHNLLYWDGSKFTADCVNLYKALFNGRDISNKTTGSFGTVPGVTGDCTEWGLLSQCEYSTNFGILGNKFEVLYMDGHIGGYLGFDYQYGGNVYNCVECTGADGDWGHDGIIMSYVTSSGQRLNHKGGWSMGQWSHHGIPYKFVQFDGGSGGGSTPVSGDTVTYQAYDGTLRKWLPEVTSGSYASDTMGMPRHALWDVKVKTSKGGVKYCVHELGKDWLPEVTGYNNNDSENGYAGDDSQIDGFALSADSLKLAYRAKLKDTQQWLEWVYSKDYDPSNDDTGMAGMLGKGIDEIEIKVVG